MNPRLLLVSPYDPDDRRYGPPKMGLGLGYLAAVARTEANAEARILDKTAEYRLSNFDRHRTEQILPTILSRFRPGVVGFSSYSAVIADVIKDARLVKHHNPNAIVLVGGPHATALPRETLRRYPFIDYVVRGEGEQALRDILKDTPPDQIGGLAYRQRGEIRVTPPGPHVNDLTRFPWPARDLMPMAFYAQPSRDVVSRGHWQYATMLASRGCHNACSFCLQVKIHRRLATRPADDVVAEMEAVLSSFPQVNAFEFLDNLFLSNVEATEQLCRAMIRSGLPRRIRWKAQTRVLSPTTDASVLRLMREAGCFLLGFGFESGSDRVLRSMNKRTTVADIRRTQDAARRADLRSDAYFIYGYPGETEAELLTTLKLIRRIRPDWAGYGRYLVVPGTRDYDRLAGARSILRHEDPNLDWEQVNIYKENARRNLTAMSDRRFAKMERLAFRAVVNPINVCYHRQIVGRSWLRSVHGWRAVAGTWLKSQPPWMLKARVSWQFRRWGRAIVSHLRRRSNPTSEGR